MDEFDNIDLRTSQNYSWSFGGDPTNLMIRDIFSRDTQRDMGDPYTRGNFYHLYVNGQYWGLFQTDERPEASYGESYLGGQKENYDTIKVDSGYTIMATDGTLDAWRDLWNQALAGFATNEAYYRAQGLNPDGTRNPNYPVLLDVDNLIDYMILSLWSGNKDAPISNFLGNQYPNNIYMLRDETGDRGFTFFAHDAEHTLLTWDLYINRNGPFPAGDTFETSNGQWIHQQLMANAEYRMRFADRVQEFFFHGGALTPEAATARLMTRAGEIQLAIIAESARWGDAKTEPALTKANWQAELDAVVNTYLPNRTSIVLDQFKNTVLRDGSPAPLYPSVSAPEFNKYGGQIDAGFNLYMSAPSGTIYYTTDGSDPRLVGGAVSPSALIFPGTLTTTTLIPTGAVWKYLDDGSDQGTAWQAPGFNDASWRSGPAQLGYDPGDENDEATRVSYGPDPNNKYVTTYFRTAFDFAGDLGSVTGLTLRLLRDDGAVLYLNGHELPRSNMPTGDINYRTYAPGVVGGADESTFYQYSIDPSYLQSGRNVLAVEVHQCNATSSDLSFDLELKVTTSSAPLVLTHSSVVSARVLSGGTWSALSQAEFLVNAPAAAGTLAITEMNYAPTAPTAAEAPYTDASDFEFIELRNVSDQPIDLAGVQFTIGITYTFPSTGDTSLQPGQYVVVAKNPAAFAVRYGSSPAVLGPYGGKLDNNGERIVLVDRFGGAIHDFSYDDAGDWPARAAGKGSSLEVVSTSGNYADDKNWRSSAEYGGSPGATGLGPFTDVVVNEILTHTDPPLSDSIELYNTTDHAIEIGGWYLSDSSTNYKKFTIPATRLESHAYAVFDESDFDPGGGTNPNDFALDGAHGDDVWLLAADGSGKLLRFVDHLDFGAAAGGESFGAGPTAAATSIR